MRKVVSVLAAAIVSALGCGSFAATNFVSKAVIVTNQCARIVTYTMSNGVARVDDPTGRLIGTAEERALKVAAEGQAEMASAAADAAGWAMEEWNTFSATTDVKVVYIDANFGQDLPALAPNLCGWIAGSYYDKTNDHYFVWFNREIDYPPSMAARVRHENGTEWMEAEWANFDETHMVQGVPCRELVVKRRNAKCVLKTGSIVTLGGPEGFDADIHKVNIEINGTPSATTTIQLPVLYVVTGDGPDRVVEALTNGFVNCENGFVKLPNKEEEEEP